MKARARLVFLVLASCKGLIAQNIAVENFDAAPQTLHLYAGGTGWFQPWYNQNAYTGPDGYSILDGNPMVHPQSLTPGSYAQGGGDNTASGRYLSPASFSDYLDANGRIGIGTVYFSFLIRKEEDTDAPVEVILADSPGQAWQVNEELIKMGYFGTTSNIGGDRYWSLSVFNETSVDLSDSLIQIGETYQIIVEIAFGTTTTVNMWVNPEEGSPDLLVPDASVSSTEDLGFWNLVLYFEGVGTGHGSFDEFIFSNNLNVVLPVEYVSWTARQEKGQVVLNWATATELNNERFEIQRSSNGNDWESIGTINGHGNSNEVIHYQFIDTSPQLSKPYYRLAQTDYDGTIHHSDILKVDLDPKKFFRVDVFQSDRYVLFFSSSTIQEIFIYNLSGQLVEHKFPNSNSIEVVTSDFFGNYYQFLLLTDQGTWRKKLRLK